jgi:tetratricopeptide (TPR) repeat protein
MLENSVEVNRAELLIARGDWEGARQACGRARELAQRRHDAQREAEALKFMGVIAREEGSLADAQREFDEAEALARAADDRLLMAEVAKETGELYRRQNRIDLARIAWSRALDLFQAMGARLDLRDTEERLRALAA